MEFQRGNHESTEMKTQVNKLKIKIKIKSKYWAQLKLNKKDSEKKKSKSWRTKCHTAKW